jgi:hypothetical protein
MINNFDCVYDMQNSDAKGNKRKQRVLFVDVDADVLVGLRVALRKAPFDSYLLIPRLSGVSKVAEKEIYLE